jgi:predicted  nucleic acid-binding Zn-ribbon protein
VDILRQGMLVAALVLASAAVYAAETADTLTPEQHLAKGEVLYNKEWVPMETLFREYLKTRAELDRLQGRQDGVQERLVTLQREMASMKSESAGLERPTRAELNKARTQIRDFNRVLDQPQPVKPKLREVPPAPPRDNNTNRNNNYGGTLSNRSNNTNDRYREWQRTKQAIDEENESKTKKYQAELKLWQQAQANAKKEMPALEATAKECEGKLAQFQADLDARLAPVLERTKAVNEEALTHNREASAVETRLKNIEEAMRSAPAKYRNAVGLVEWNARFYTIAELEQRHTRTQTEIDSVRTKLKTESEAAGISFPESWRHPQQDEMDQLKALVEQAKKNQATARQG